MREIKNKKIIGIVSILIVLLIISLLTYGNNKKKVFKDEYMNNIFVEEKQDEIVVNNKEENIKLLEVNNENNDMKIDNSLNENKIVVEIKGEVVNPDVYTLNDGSIIKDLIDIAGGLTKEANISNINRAKELKNHELIIIYNINDKAEEQIQETISDSNGDDGIININTASESELKSIPGIGDVKAKSIISYREKNGGFKSIDEIRNIDGIGDKTFEKIKDLIKI